MALQMEVDSLELKIESNADGAAAKVDALTAALANLKKTARVPKGLSDVAVLLERINKFSGANLNINLDAGKAKEFSGAMKSITKESRKSEDALKDVNQQTKIFGTSGKSASLRALIKDVYGFARKAYGKIKSLVDEGTDYVETINLAQVAMKDYFAEAEAYANRVNDKLGVDPAAWLKTQATFMAMGTGFGFTENKAYQLSKALTELSYDISSLYNEDIETATQRLQSAFAGEIEPIRRLGISISQATLEEFALSKGITESVSAMTEQEKSLLRTLKIIEDSKKIGAVGDLARTIEQPANAIRVLNQQFTQLKRTIGTTFIPLSINVIPYLQAATELLTDMVSGIATLVGFEMPEWDADSWNGLENGADGVTGSIEEATEAAKELKRQTAGFDELNVLSANDGSGISADSGTSSWVNDLEIPSLWDDTVLDQIADKTTEIKNNLKPMVDGALLFGAALLALKIPDTVTSAFNKLDNLLAKKGVKTAIGISLLVEGISFAVDAGELLAEGKDATLKTILGAAASALGGYLVFGSAVGGLAGAAIGLGIGLAATIASMAIKLHENAAAEAAKKFKETEAGKIIELAMEAINEVAEKNATLELKIKNITGEISADDAGKIELARQLISDIYGLTEKDNLSSTELGLVSGWIETLNGLGLDGIQLEFDSVTGKIKQSRAEVEGLLKDIENTIKSTALMNAYTDSYSAGAEAKRNYDAAYEAYEKLASVDVTQLDPFALFKWKAAVSEASKALESATLNYMEASEKIEYFSDAHDKLQAEINGINYDEATKSINDFTKDAIKDIRDLQKNMGTGLSGISAEIDTFVKKFGENLGGLVGNGITAGGRFAVTFSAYADGGFPTMGDLFIANEEKPEFVGTLGGRTAVANNDQIVAGIANGVASANAAQNALLREQNNILLAILQKTGIVTLDGKMLDHSIEQYRSNKGASIMSGGVR